MQWLLRRDTDGKIKTFGANNTAALGTARPYTIDVTGLLYVLLKGCWVGAIPNFTGPTFPEP